MKFLKNPCNIYITLWCLYNLQGALYTQGGWFSKSVLLVLLIWSVYLFLVTIIRFKMTVFLKILAGIVFIFTIYGLVPIVTGTSYGQINSFQYLKQILMSLLTVYVFYYYARKDYLTVDLLKKWVVVFFFIAIIVFFYDQSEHLEEATREGVTSRKSYVVLSLITLVPLFYKKPVIQYVMMGVVMLFLLLGMKRGAILTGALAGTWLLINILFVGNGKKNNFKGIALTIVLVFATIYAVEYYIATNDYFNYRIEQTMEGNSSGRDEIFKNGIDVIFHGDSVINFLFGYGPFGTRKTLGIFAHNDWLEIGINNGIIVLLLYFYYWVQFFKYSRKSRQNKVLHQVIALFFITYFMKSFFSMSYSTYTIYSTSALGLALSLMEKDKELIRK